MLGVVTVNRTIVRMPGVTPPSSTLQNEAGRFSSRTTHCDPRLSLTMRSGRPTRSGVLFLLSPANRGTARQRMSTAKPKCFMHNPPQLKKYERVGRSLHQSGSDAL